MERTFDTLQDLCICYCVEHLAYLGLDGTGNVNPPSEDIPVEFSPSLSPNLCKELLKKYLNCHVAQTVAVNHCPSPTIDSVFSLLLKKASLKEMHLVRFGILSDSMLRNISNSHIMSLNLLTGEEYSFENKNIEMLLRQNRFSIRNLKLCGDFGLLMDEEHISLYPVLEQEIKNTLETETHVAGRLDRRDDNETEGNAKSKDINSNDVSFKQGSRDESETTNVSPISDKNVQHGINNACDSDTFLKETHWFKFPNMQSVTLVNTDTLPKKRSEFIIESFLASNPQLICVCIVCIDAIGLLPNVAKLRNLTSLSLSSSNHLQTDTTCSFKCLENLDNLRHLDVSSSTRFTYATEDVVQFVKYVESATKLVSLELGGTNLSLIVGHEKLCYENLEFSPNDCNENCTAPIEQNRRFEYLGLVNCPNDPYLHRCIPANEIGGLNGERQLLTALRKYQHNFGLMRIVLDHLDNIHPAPEEMNLQFYPVAYIDTLLAFLNQYQDWSVPPGSLYSVLPVVEIIGLVLAHIYQMLAKGPGRQPVSVTQRRKLLERMMVLSDNCLRSFRDDVQNNIPHLEYVLRMSLNVLSRLLQPHDAVYCYKVDKYINTLTRVVTDVPRLNVKVIALDRLDVICRFSQDLKGRVGGEFELIKRVLYFIAAMTGYYSGDEEFFESAWNILWLLSDELPSNCTRFADNAGIAISIGFIEQYPEAYELHWIITGILCNVSEIQELRPALRQKELVNLIRKLLDNVPGDNKQFEEEGIDVTAHATALLVRLAADGPDTWTIDSPSRESIMKDVENVIDTWQIDKFRGVDFRSLSPILRYMEYSDVPVAQYWACWMICNLFTCTPSKYTPMFKEEGGVEIICRIRKQPVINSSVERLADKIAEIIDPSTKDE